jgi:hypothetical protein
VTEARAKELRGNLEATVPARACDPAEVLGLALRFESMRDPRAAGRRRRAHARPRGAARRARGRARWGALMRANDRAIAMVLLMFGLAIAAGAVL